jgi:photosystem II stability/assembly factor-like uncharacterized protein
LLEGLRWRLVGPFRGGRVTSVCGDPVHRNIFYFGACAGGVWRTDDGGHSWHNVTDGYVRSASVGAVVVAPSDPQVLYVGMGEACIRNNVYGGDGVYRSLDGGRTWQHVGLEDTRHIGRIVVHPQRPDVVYVAALGHAFGPNEERGVFRSRDGGATWERVWYVGPHVGAVDLAMDAENPRVLYASLWEVRRTPYHLSSGGPGSALYRSVDGGDTWEKIHEGLPQELLGRIGLAASARPGRLWATVEAAEGGGIYRSDDYGDHWIRTSQDPELRQRPWYFNHLTADPVDPDTVWATNFHLWRSTDGGVTFQEVPAAHVDHHALWIDPRDPLRLINGHDGGAAVSYDGGRTWSTILNQPTGQFYHVTTDRQVPYRIYAAQQDNTTLSLPSRSSRPGIGLAETYSVGGGESGYIAVHPTNPHMVFAGANGSVLTRYDVRTSHLRYVTPWPEEVTGTSAGEQRYRFAWTFPIHFSPHDPDTLYACAQVVFRTRTQGQSWEVISPDLTRHDPRTLGPSGGPVTLDQTGAETYATIFAFAESPVRAGLLWAGSDDGLVHVREREGAVWENVTPPDLPEWSLISMVEASPHRAETAYVVANRYKLDDPRPYVYRTDDLGRTWRRITAGLGPEDAARALREDPQVPGLLYLATDRGVYVSWDGGETWRSLQANLPLVPVHDLVVHGDDLVVATHGRGIWVLDDVGPLRLMARSPQPPVWYVPQVAYRLRVGRPPEGRTARGLVDVDHDVFLWEKVPGPDGEEVRFLNAGENPRGGLTVLYHLASPAREGRLTIADAAGQVLAVWEGAKEGGPAPNPARSGSSLRGTLPLGAGVHRVHWDLRAPGPEDLPGTVYRGSEPKGPLVPPATYTAVLEVDGVSYQASFRVEGDPAIGADPEELKAQYAFLVEIQNHITRIHRAVRRARALQEELARWRDRLQGSRGAEDVLERIQRLSSDLEAWEGRLVQTRAKSPKDLLKYPPGLNVKLASLLHRVGVSEAAPTQQDQALWHELSRSCQEALDQLRQLWEQKALPLAQDLAALGLPLLPDPLS